MKKNKGVAYKLVSLVLSSALIITGCGNLQSTTKSSGNSATSSVTPASSASQANLAFSARDLDASYDETTATKISLSDNEIKVSGEGALVKGKTVNISKGGTYILTGTLSDGQVIIYAPKTEIIQLVLNGVSIHNEDQAAIHIKEADHVLLTLAPASENILSDGSSYILDKEADNVDGVIFSKADVTINGSGLLNVTGNYKHGIVSKDTLVITGGTITVTANGQGLSGKDCVKIKDGTFVLNTQGDAIQSDNAEDTAKGFIYIAGGTFNINTLGDAFQAENLLQTDGGKFDITTGGGSANASNDQKGEARGDWGKWDRQQAQETVDTTKTASAKGLKAGSEMILNEGSFNIDSLDDALHSNGSLIVTGGSYAISSGDDGLHADGDLSVSGGTLQIDKSYEGIEGNTITLSGGLIKVIASDDGLNVAGGNDNSSFGRPGLNNFSNTGPDKYLRINGGEIIVNASGDGLDCNGNLYIEGGITTVSGPVNDRNGALDYNGTATISGGVLMATGSSGMAQGFSDTSSQCSLLYNLPTLASAGSTVTLSDSKEKIILSWTAEKNFSSIVLSCPELVQGETYTLTAGSSSNNVTLTSVATSNGGGMGWWPKR